MSKGTGLSGLINLGNTCYLNSIIQALSHCHEFNNIIHLEKTKKNMKNNVESKLLHEYAELQKLLWSKNCVIKPGKFLTVFQETARKKNLDTFTGFDQNDVSECLYFLINSFHESLSREVNMTIDGKPKNRKDLLAIKCFESQKLFYEKEFSEMLDLFYGFSCIEKKKISDQTIEYIPEPYFTLNLPIPLNKKETTLYECFDNYLNLSKSDDDNFNMRTLFWSLPNILIVSLQRFHMGNLRKNHSFVDFPIKNCDLTKYVEGYNQNSYKYELFAICNHSGSMNGGHYTCIVNVKGLWFHINDNQVQIIDENKIITEKAYFFFYRKKTI